MSEVQIFRQTDKEIRRKTDIQTERYRSRKEGNKDGCVEKERYRGIWIEKDREAERQEKKETVCVRGGKRVR